MSRLSQADQSALLCGLHELYAQTNVQCLHETLVRVATRLVPCDLGSYNEYLRADARPVFALRFPDSIDVLKHSPAFRTYFGQHPVARHNRETGDTDVRKLSDFLTARQLGRLSLYNEYFREIGVRYQMVLLFKQDGETQRAISLNRSDRDFSERDRQVLNLLQPHLSQAYQNATELSRLQVARNAMEQVQAASGQAMLIVNAAGGVQWLCRQARQWLQEFLGLELEADAALPPGIARWLNGYSQHRDNPDHTLHAPPSALRFSRPPGFLQIRRAAEDAGGNITLLLTIERPANQAMPLRIPGLTPRENEVLGWIAHGKGNPEIAAILGLSVRTVYKHVENIFPKLGVENRNAAMLRALQAATAPNHE